MIEKILVVLTLFFLFPEGICLYILWKQI